jgi:hypothetical protein
MKPYEALLKVWSEVGEQLHEKPASPAEIAELEVLFGVHLPEDFRDYLLYALPRSGVELDRRMTTWWGAPRIASDQSMNGQAIAVDGNSSNPHRYLIFADHLIWCWAWAIACGDTDQRGKVIEIGHLDRVVANDFASFVNLNIHDDDSLY